MKISWVKVDQSLHASMEGYQSRVARHRGNLPEAMFINRTQGRKFSHVAIQYLEPGKWERWLVRSAHSVIEIAGTWSNMLTMMRPLIGDRSFIEVYPRDEEVVNMSPVRHFWILPDGIQAEFDLRGEPGA